MRRHAVRQKTVFFFLLVLVVLFLIMLPAGKQKAQSTRHQRNKALSDTAVTEVEVVIEQVAKPAQTAEPQTDQANASAEKEVAGAFPPFWCSYREQVGFRRYATEMERRGAVFFLYSRTKEGWFQVNRDSATLKPFNIEQIGRVFGSKPNCIDDEPALGVFASDEPDNAIEVFLAKPMAMEAQIQSTVRQALNSRNIPLTDVTGFKGIYDFVNGQFSLVITEIAIRNLGAKSMNLAIPL